MGKFAVENAVKISPLPLPDVDPVRASPREPPMRARR